MVRFTKMRPLNTYIFSRLVKPTKKNILTKIKSDSDQYRPKVREVFVASVRTGLSCIVYLFNNNCTCFWLLRVRLHF